MDLGRVYLPENRIDCLLALVRSFSKIGQYKTALLFLGLLGVCPHSHASHPVVPEAMLEPRNPQVAVLDPSKKGSQPGASVVVIQGTPFPGSSFFSTQHHHNYHDGCENGGMGRLLLTANVDHGTLQWPLVKFRMPTPHQRVGAQGGSPDPTPSGTGDP